MRIYPLHLDLRLAFLWSQGALRSMPLSGFGEPAKGVKIGLWESSSVPGWGPQAFRVDVGTLDF